MVLADRLTWLLRKLQQVRELNESTYLDVLGACSALPVDDVPEKFIMLEYCELGAWEQAALWMLPHCLPSWRLELCIAQPKTTARLISRCQPPLVVERSHARPATALLEAIVQACLGLERLGVHSPGR